MEARWTFRETCWNFTDWIWTFVDTCYGFTGTYCKFMDACWGKDRLGRTVAAKEILGVNQVNT
jgi:hypothetical protein